MERSSVAHLCLFFSIRSEKSPSINKQGIAVNGKNTLPRNVCVQEAAEHKKHHRSGQILHAVEAAEKTIVSAVRNEVDILFNDKDHPHVKNVSAICKKDTSRTSRRQQQQQQHQQIILSSDRNRFGWGLDQVTDF